MMAAQEQLFETDLSGGGAAEEHHIAAARKVR
jgi:hypothetical protein